MGAGIAYVSALAGIEVVLIDRDQESADKGKATIDKLISGQVTKGRAKTADQDALLARITATPITPTLAGCDLVVEAVFEDRAVKAEVTKKRAGGRRRPMRSSPPTPRRCRSPRSPRPSLQPENFVGIHFFSPVEKMLLVEVIMGKKTGDRALATALDFVRCIKKTPIVVNDSRGFYANRCVLNYVREGHLMLTEGVPPAMIENAARMAGMPVGPLSLNDEVALDLALEDRQGDQEGSRREAAVDPTQERVLRFMVEENGRLGRKNGKGFYDYPRRRQEDACGRACRRSPTAKLDPDTIDVDELKQRFLVDAGGGGGAHHRGGRRHRSARGGCRLDPRLRLRALHRRHAVLHRRHGRDGLRRALRRARRRNMARASRRRNAARDGGEGRDLLRTLPPAEEGGVARVGANDPSPLRGGRPGQAGSGGVLLHQRRGGADPHPAVFDRRLPRRGSYGRPARRKKTFFPAILRA